MLVMARKNKELKDKDTIETACEFYVYTPKYNKLSTRSKKDYDYNFKRICETKVQNNKKFGNIRLRDLRFKHVTVAYDMWLSSVGTRQANYMATCLSIVLNTAIRHEALLSNPVTLIQRTQDRARKVRWTDEQVVTFLNTAYSRWRWRSIGLILHMAYEWAQRIGDMRTLKWSNVDLENKILELEQSKRRAQVRLPIEGSLLEMLKKQHEDFGFQQYVAPAVEPHNGVYRAYPSTDIHKLVNEVKAAADLPREITAMDLRRTGITQLVEGGVDTFGIMQVSGHSNPQSVKPYLVNTLSGATNALSQRKK
jgi:integrase